MNTEQIEDFCRYPAVKGVARAVVILKEGNVVGHGRVGSSSGDGTVAVYYNAEGMSFLKDDEAVQALGKFGHFRFFETTGEYTQTFADEDENRCEGVSIVDAVDFAFGIASRLRYSQIKGFGVYDRDHVDYYENQVESPS